MVDKYGAIESVNIIEELLGKVFVDVVVSEDKTEMLFVLENGDKYVFYHEQDCCELVQIEDITGDISDLIGSPITMAEETIHENICVSYDSATYTFYKFATVKGYVTVRWCGSSNGYYSESVDFEFKEKR